MLSDQDITSFYNEVGENIRASRKLRNINQEDLSHQLGISRVSLVNIENGKQKAPIHVLLEIAEFLKVPLPELLPSLSLTSNSIDPSIVNKVNKEVGGSPQSADKAIDFIKAYISKTKK